MMQAKVVGSHGVKFCKMVVRELQVQPCIAVIDGQDRVKLEIVDQHAVDGPKFALALSDFVVIAFALVVFEFGFNFFLQLLHMRL